MPWPQTAPVRFTHLKSRPSVTFAAALQQSTAVLTQRGTIESFFPADPETAGALFAPDRQSILSRNALLFMCKCDHRIDARRATRRDQTGDDRDKQENASYRGNRRKVVGTEAV